jgi:hypothetical protein
MLGVVADHGNWPVERISIGCGMGQLSIEPEEDKSAKIAKNKVKMDQDETVEQQRRWWVGSVGHDDTLRMTDLEGFFREAETGEGALAADVRDDDSDTEVDKKLEEDSQEKPKIKKFGSSDQHEGDESSGDSDIPVPKKRRRKAEKDASNMMKKHKGKKSIAVERSFFDDL